MCSSPHVKDKEFGRGLGEETSLSLTSSDFGTTPEVDKIALILKHENYWHSLPALLRLFRKLIFLANPARFVLERTT